MTKKTISHEQYNLFGASTVIAESKKKKSVISEEEREKRKEKREAFVAWKLLKSTQFSELLTDRQKFLLQKHYNITL